MSNFETVRTNDMAMVTFLRMRGHPVQDVFWSNHTCYWTFLHTDFLVEAMEEFMKDQALVNPREYTRQYGETKKEFYTSRPAV